MNTTNETVTRNSVHDWTIRMGDATGNAFKFSEFKQGDEWTNRDPICFNGDRLHILGPEIVDHQASLYHRLPSGNEEFLQGTILDLRPDAILFRWHDWNNGVTREHWLNGNSISHWTIGKRN